MATMTDPALMGALLAGPAQPVHGGVDTHDRTHTGCVLSGSGGRLGVRQFPADTAGYQAMLAWMASFGDLVAVGVEGTGSYGAGLTRVLLAAGVKVVEVNRPDRAERRRLGKSDPIDAEHAARAVLSGTAESAPKVTDGPVEALRNLRIARRSAVQQRADTMRQIKSQIVTAPDRLRQELAVLSDVALIRALAASRPRRAAAVTGDVEAAVKYALRTLAHRHQTLTDEIDDLDQMLKPLVTTINPALIAVFGVGPDVAGQLLVTCGQNADRLRSDAALAALCGASPVPASSGKTTRQRVNRGGDRATNSALWRIAFTRIGQDPRTRDYVALRTAQGHSHREIIRCLKRALCRELYPLLTT